jgi:hypothetical protein
VVGGGKRTLDVFFFAKKAQNERWEVVAGQEIQIFYKKTKKRPCKNLDSLNLELWNAFIVFSLKKKKHVKSQITAGTHWNM